MKKGGAGAVKVAAAYIGTIVGAGFATGQEVMQFFLRYGGQGLWGVLLTTLLFVLFGGIIMLLGRQLSARSHLQVIRYAGGRIVGRLTDFIITFFLFGALTAMLAGTGALFSQQLGLPSAAGAVFMAVITAMTVLTGIGGVVNAISAVVPFLLTSVVGISVWSIVTAPPSFAAPPAAEGASFGGTWLMSAILYTSYNTIISVAVLSPLGMQARSKRAVVWGAVLGGLGLGLGSALIFLAMSGHAAQIVALEVPMTYIAGTISPVVQIIYTVILIAEVYTTAVGSLYGFCARLTEGGKPPADYRKLIFGTSVAALFASFLGFSNLVKYLYTFVGYAGLVLLASLLYVWLKPKPVKIR